MKKVILITYFTLGYIYLFAQDSITKQNSWSITANVNIIYPTTDQFNVKSDNNNPSYGYEWNVIPKWSINPRFVINYEHMIFATRTSSYSIVSGVGYVQNNYKSIYKGWYITDFPPFGDSGTFKTNIKDYYIEINLGLVFNVKFKKSFFWNNQFTFITDVLVKGETPIYYENNIKSRFYLYYQTGLKFRLYNNFYFTPIIILPVTELWKKNNSHYGSFISGFVFTYTKIKKK